jgi:hypothetical protein
MSRQFFGSFSERSSELIKRILASLFIFTLILGAIAPPLNVSAQALSSPAPITPAAYSVYTAVAESGAVVAAPVALPEFSWGSVDGAKQYQLQVSQDIAFSTSVEFKTPLTKYTPTNVAQFSDGLWYWRVRVSDPNPGSDFTQPIPFTRQWASPGNAPSLVSPGDSATLDFFGAAAFSWQPAVGAAYYRFQIAADLNGFNAPIYNQTTLATTHQPPTKFANGTYYWRVVPYDAANHEGTSSEVRQYTLAYGSTSYFPNEVPTLLEPLDKNDLNYTPPTFTPTFRWGAVRGASIYRLEYTSDPTCNFGVAGYTTSVETRNTTYTPTNAFPNDVNYCWRVRAQSGNSISDWSETWEFIKQWYIQAIPLTPVNNYQYDKYPFFSWTPVPGAAYYKIEVSDTNSFPYPHCGFTANTVNPFYVKHDYYWASLGCNSIWYWRVTPYDRNNNAGKPSDGYPQPNPASFVQDYNSMVPNLVYPLYYYLPNNFPSPDENVSMQPHEDRTVPLPVFMWNRVFDTSGNEAAAYRVQVDDDPLFQSVNWDFRTENLSAAPTTAYPFSPQANKDYSWRVCILASLNGSCTSPWSQVWQTRFDPSKALAPTSQITLLRPLNASENVESTPLFEWWPLQGATSYQVQISQDPNFGSTVIDEQVLYPAYTPQTSLAQRSLNHLAFGTYYWRVRGWNGGSTPGNWSAPWRFQVAAQSQWRYTRTLGNSENKLLVASDPDDISDNNFELTGLYVAQDKDYWYFGFDATTGATNMTYGLYLDLDHTDGSGATSDARTFNVTTIAAHRPEYAIYFLQQSSAFSAANIMIYRWTGTGWSNSPQTLTSVGGALYTGSNYVEIKVPNTAIGMGEDTNSASLSLFSVDQNTKNIQDSVPSSTSTSVLDRFTSVSEHLNLAMPPSNASGDPSTYSSVLPFFFNYPSSTPWEGFNIQVALDARFTTPTRNYVLTANIPYLSPPIYTEQTKVQDIQGDNTYYWRVRPQYYYTSTNIAGSWSQVASFERQGFVPQNLHVSVNFATPTFSWDIVEGASYYDLQVDNDPNFGSPDVAINTAQNSYTPPTTLANGTYYWRVRVQRDGNVSANDWSPAQSFVLAQPIPTNLTPNDPQNQNVIGHAPTFCWDPLIATTNNVGILAAYKYRLQISKGDPTFSQIYDAIDTEQACWTPVKGYDDGQYYWRVAMMDGQGRLGDYSPAAVFTKQYPVTTLISPLGGPPLIGTPTFKWTSVPGAASYRLEVSQYSTFSPLYQTITTNAVDYTPTMLYASPKTYYWRVAIIDKDGKLGPFNNETIILDPNSHHLYLPLVH